MLNFNNNDSFLELVSDGDQINLSSNAIGNFDYSRNQNFRDAKSVNSKPKNMKKFNINQFPSSIINHKMS